MDFHAAYSGPLHMAYALHAALKYLLCVFCVQGCSFRVRLYEQERLGTLIL
jgi:hypothetical protein